MQGQSSAAKPNKVVSRPTRRETGSEVCGLGLKLAERSVCLLEFVRCQWKFLNRHIVEMQLRETLQKGHHRKAVQPSTKTRFGDCQVSRTGEPVGKAISLKEYVACLGKTVLKTEIAILEIHGMKHPVTKFSPCGCEIIDGADMRRGRRHHSGSGSIPFAFRHLRKTLPRIPSTCPRLLRVVYQSSVRLCLQIS